MTDRELMVERIQNAMNALDLTHAAGSELRKDANSEKLQVFKEHMHELCEKLGDLKVALEHQAVYAEDELINLFSELFSGEETPYRHMPEIEKKK